MKFWTGRVLDAQALVEIPAVDVIYYTFLHNSVADARNIVSAEIACLNAAAKDMVVEMARLHKINTAERAVPDTPDTPDTPEIANIKRRMLAVEETPGVPPQCWFLGRAPFDHVERITEARAHQIQNTREDHYQAYMDLKVADDGRFGTLFVEAVEEQRLAEISEIDGATSDCAVGKWEYMDAMTLCYRDAAEWLGLRLSTRTAQIKVKS